MGLLSRGLGIASLLVLVLVIGCNRGDKSSQSPDLTQARLLLRTEKEQDALDLLEGDQSAEGRYLRAIALNRLRSHRAALDEIKQAETLDEGEVKYQAFRLFLTMATPDLATAEEAKQAAKELAKLYEDHSSSAAVALFATSAFGRERRVDRMAEAFDGALAQSEQIPEFHHEMLQFSLATNRPGAADNLAQKLLQAAQDDPQYLRTLLSLMLKGERPDPAAEVLKRLDELQESDLEIEIHRVQLSLQQKNVDQAIAFGENLHSGKEGGERTAMILAKALSESKASKERDDRFWKLAQEYPKNLEILAKYCLYMARSNRVEQAINAIHIVESTLTTPISQHNLANLAIALPLGAGKADLAEEELNRYKDKLPTPDWVTLFQGRIMFVRKDFKNAKKAFDKLVNHPEAEKPHNVALVKQAREWWVQTIQAEAMTKKPKKKTE